AQAFELARSLYPMSVTCCLSSTTSYFFFQAEDGIRDRTVTGVQTCALPILRLGSPSRRQVIDAMHGRIFLMNGYHRFTYVVRRRSEERRVGKECTPRWSAGEYIETTNVRTTRPHSQIDIGQQEPRVSLSCLV